MNSYFPVALSGLLLTATIWAFPKTSADYEWWLTPVRPNYASSQVPRAPTQLVPIAVDAVKLRQGPAETFRVLTVLRRGALVEVLESRGPDTIISKPSLKYGHRPDGWWHARSYGGGAKTVKQKIKVRAQKLKLVLGCC